MARRLPPLALAYHSVEARPLRDDPFGLCTSPRRLERHIRRLQAWGYELVTFGELAHRAVDGDVSGAAALTFDDGFADNLHVLLPLLREYRARATVFVVSSWLGERHPQRPHSAILTADELRTLAAHGIEVGSHTVTHPDLSALGFDEARGELATSKHDLEAVLDAAVDVVAYPYGKASATTLAACAAAGFRAGCRVSGNGTWDDPFNIPRQDMDNGATLLGLRLKRDDRYEPLVGTAVGRLPLRGIRAARRWTGR
jgi:peptidoglycan/xylan/chitin deacetylase (PgdA/CDA1 family)